METSAAKARHDDFELLEAQVSEVKQTEQFMFDKANLPLITLPQIPHKMRAD